MSFGTSYSIKSVNPIDWVRTKLIKRIIRGVLGLSIAMSLYYAILLINPVD